MSNQQLQEKAMQVCNYTDKKLKGTGSCWLNVLEECIEIHYKENNEVRTFKNHVWTNKKISFTYEIFKEDILC